MERKLASIQKIIKLEPIEGADRIEKATVLGWNLVVKKDEFKEGDLCVYFEVDSLLPLLPEFNFLEAGGARKKISVNGQEIEGYRLRTVKLRGQVSQGLAFPIHKLITTPNSIELKEGQDVTGMLGVYKYEPPMPANLGGQAKGFLPGYIPKTDEMRIQAFPDVLTKYQNIPFYVTEKVDGSSATLWIDKMGEFNVASRSINWKRDDKNTFWKTAIELNVEEKLKKYPYIALQGELLGEGLQSNRLKITGHTILFYNAYDFAIGKYLDFIDFEKLMAELGLKTVPILDKEYYLPKNIDEIVKFVTAKSYINQEVWREGCVFRPLTEMQDEDLGRLSFKVINPEYLLEYKE